MVIPILPQTVIRWRVWSVLPALPAPDLPEPFLFGLQKLQDINVLSGNQWYNEPERLLSGG